MREDYHKEYRKLNKERIKVQKRIYMQTHPEARLKRVARNKVRSMLRNGQWTRQPCEICNNPRGEAHHTDYSKPLDVRWLCREHHILADRGMI
jgi:hypothetical protein